MTSHPRITSAIEAVAAVPFALGFHPADSLVAVGLLGHRMIFAARCDLPPDDQAEQLGQHLVAVAARQGVDGLALIGYGPEAQVGPAVQRAALAVASSRVMLLDAVRVTDGLCWSYLCDDDGCCPKPCPPPDNVVAFQATIAGQVALPDREALVAQFEPVAGEQRAAMTAATTRAMARLAGESAGDPQAGLAQAGAAQAGPNQAAPDQPGPAQARPPAQGDESQRAEPKHDEPQGGDGPHGDGQKETDSSRGKNFTRAVRRSGRRAVRDAERRYRSGRALTDDEVAWLGIMLVDLEVRDYAWERTGEEQWRITMWTDVLRRVEPAYVAAPASLLSFAAWRKGMGSVARVAVDRALAADPDYGMADQMNYLLLYAVSPEMVRNWPTIDRNSAEPPTPGSPHDEGPVAGPDRRVAERVHRDARPGDRRSAQSRADRPGVRQPGAGERVGGRHAAPRKLRRRSL